MERLHDLQIGPPQGGSYDYLDTLNYSELAWEFLRRNPDYQRDFATLTTPIQKPQIVFSGHRVWQAPDLSSTLSHWGLWPLVDPRLSALDAPTCWLPDTGAAVLIATATRARVAAEADFNLNNLSCVRHIVVRKDGAQYLLVHNTDLSIFLQIHGDRIVDAPINVTFQLHRLAVAAKAGLWLSKLPGLLATPQRHICFAPRRKNLRDALIALDGHLAGAQYRDVAHLIFGRAEVVATWSKSDRRMKDSVIRSLRRGRELARSGYLRLMS
jgi:Uncharacterized conserved protein (DUF2285)/Family of unknown function (DUF6499)